MTAEDEVRRSLATDRHYPLGERDAMKWAIAFRLTRERHGWTLDDIDDGLMVAWFANCMATAARVDTRDSPREILARALEARGPSWFELADRLRRGEHYTNDEIHVGIALDAISGCLA